MPFPWALLKDDRTHLELHISNPESQSLILWIFKWPPGNPKKPGILAWILSPKSLPLRPVTVTLFGNRAFVDAVSEKAMAPHSRTLAWNIPWMEEPGRLQSMGVTKSRTWLSDFTFTFHFHALEEEMATHSCSYLENPRDGGAWWAAGYGVTQSRTWLKWFSSSSSN